MFESLMEFGQELVSDFGLPGLFVVMVIGSSPIPIPVELFVLGVLSLGAPPIPTALFAGIGATLGGLISYYLGKTIIRILKAETKYKNQMEKSKGWLDRYGIFAVFIFALTPLPYDAMAILCGGIKMELKYFILATFSGRIIRYSFLVYAGSKALEILYPF